MKVLARLLRLSLFSLLLVPSSSYAQESSGIAWQAWSSQAFSAAAQQKKFILLNVHAAWCHWCHVMEDTTYKDPRVQALIRAHFVPVQVDVDARPDIAERYGKIGWPATAFFTPDGKQLKEVGAYIDPETFLALLNEIIGSGIDISSRSRSPLRTRLRFLRGGPSLFPSGHRFPLSQKSGRVPARSRQVALKNIDSSPSPIIQQMREWAERELQRYYDPALGGWGRRQKAPVADAVEYALFKGRAKQAYYTLLSQRPMLDPVWGGMYQYSDGGVWTRPHFEKIMTVQAGALENYAQAFQASQDVRFRSVARMMAQYFRDFLLSPEGAFYTSQDADLGDVHGPDYFCLSDKERRSLGIPRVDKNVYARENGLAIAAFAKLYAAISDEEYKTIALKAADEILKTHANANGGFSHAAGGQGPYYLADNAAFGLALLQCYEISGAVKYRDAARRCGDFVLREFPAADGLGFLSRGEDKDTPAGFDAPIKPFQDNALAARFLMKLHGHTADKRYKETAGKTLEFLSDRKLLEEQGRFLGTYLLAAEEFRGEPLHLLIVGPKSDPRARELHRACLDIYSPNKIVQWEDARENPAILKTYPAFEYPVVYVCGENRCSPPLLNKTKILDVIL